MKNISSVNDSLAAGSLQKVLQAQPGFIRTVKENEGLTVVNTANEKFRSCKQVVVCGIGGSSLGIKVIKDYFQKSNLFLLENVDGYDFKRMTEWVVNPREVAFVFISKSGSTLETLVLANMVAEWGADKSIDIGQQGIVISERKSSSLFSWAEKYKMQFIEMPVDVGGRYSVLTSVGMMPAALMGLDILKFHQGALSAIQNPQPVQEFVSAVLQSWERQQWITNFWFYGSSLKSLGEWIVQLWSESLGKKVNRQGLQAPRASTPMVAVGSIDQHSMLQQLMEGFVDKWPVIVRADYLEKQGPVLDKSLFKETALVQGLRLGDILQIEATSTRDALAEQGLKPFELMIQGATEKDLGYWFMFFELVVASLAEAMDINAYDQPGVELGKRLANEKLKLGKLSSAGARI